MKRFILILPFFLPLFFLGTSFAHAQTVLFSDGFESGDFSHTENGIHWSSVVYVDATTSIAHSGTYAARFEQGDHSPWSELRFDGISNEPEVYLQYYMYMPSGTESPSIGVKNVVLGKDNDKFFRLWGGGDAGYDYGGGNSAHPYGNKVGASTWGNGDTTGDGHIGFEFENSTAPTQWDMGESGGGPADDGTAVHVPFVDDANRGRWIQIRIHAKNATSANNDGVLQMWVDGTLIMSRRHATNGDIYNAGGPTGYTTGYLLGWADNNFAPGQFTYIDDFTISTGGFPGDVAANPPPVTPPPVVIPPPVTPPPSSGGTSISGTILTTPITTPAPIVATTPLDDPLLDLVSLITANRALFEKAQSLGITLPPLIEKVLTTGSLTQADLDSTSSVTFPAPLPSSTPSSSVGIPVSSTPTSHPSLTLSSITRPLQLNYLGTDVILLQNFLIQTNAGPEARALAQHGANGSFGPLTQRALIEYQKSVGEEGTGVWGKN